MPILLLRVEAEGDKFDCCYLDLEHVRTTDSLLQQVQQLAWDLLPGACQIQAKYADDEGDYCTLTEQTAKDALSFATPHEGIDDTVLLTVIVHGVWAQEAQLQHPAAAPTEVPAARRFDGAWSRRGPGFQHVISGDTVTFADGQIGKLRLTGASSAELELKGETLTAELEAGGSILWSDGQVWTQHDAEPECEMGNVEAMGQRDQLRQQCDLFKVQLATAEDQVGSAVASGDVARDKLAKLAVVVDDLKGQQTNHDQQCSQHVEALRHKAEELEQVQTQRDDLKRELAEVQRQHGDEVDAMRDAAVASGNVVLEDTSKLMGELDEAKRQAANAEQRCQEKTNILLDVEQSLETLNARHATDVSTLQGQIAAASEEARCDHEAAAKQHQEQVREVEEAHASTLKEVQDALGQRSDELETCQQQCVLLKERFATAESRLEFAVVSEQTAQENSERLAAELDEAMQQSALGEQQGVTTAEVLHQNLHELETLKSELGERKTYCRDLERQLEEIETRHGKDSKAWMDVAADAQSKLATAEAQSARRAQALQDMEQTLNTLRERNAAEAQDAKMKLEEARQHHMKQVHEIQKGGAANLQKAEEQREQFQRQLAEAEKQHGDVCARWGEEVKAKTAAAAASGHVAQQLTEDLHDTQRQLKSALQVCEERANALQDRTQEVRQAECKAEAAQSSENTLKNIGFTPNYSASVLTLKDSPLTLGIEAEEDDSARGDVTKELEDVVASYGARAAFRIGRMRLPATFSEVAPACARVAVQNDGPSRWPPTTVIVNVEGDSLGLQVMALGILEPGEIKEVEMDLEVGSKSESSSHSPQKRLYRPRHAMPQLAPRFVLGEAHAESRSIWAILDAATGERLGPLLVFEAVWDLL